MSVLDWGCWRVLEGVRISFFIIGYQEFFVGCSDSLERTIFSVSLDRRKDFK